MCWRGVVKCGPVDLQIFESQIKLQINVHKLPIESDLQ